MFTLIAVVAVAGVFGIITTVPMGQMTVHSLTEKLTVEDMVKRADLIVIGTIVDQKTEPRGNDKNNPLRSVTTVKPTEILKGSVDTPTIKVYGSGDGEAIIDGIRMMVVVLEKAEFKNGENTVLFLDYDEGNVLGTGYYVIGESLGKYDISGDKAVHVDSAKTESLVQLKQRIATSISEN